MSSIHPLRVVAKAIMLFLLFDLLYAVVNPPVGRLSIYNWLIQGRVRLPYAGGAGGYNLWPVDMDAAFASHVISAAPKAPDEYRVILLGDSSTWGVTVQARDSLTTWLNKSDLVACGKHLKFYNLAYPGPSALKDFFILHQGLRYQPDLVVWMLTMNSLVVHTPSLRGGNNWQAVSDLLHEYQLDRYQQFIGPPPNFFDQTLIGERTTLARLAMLQAYGLLWNATGIDAPPQRQIAPPDVPGGLTYSLYGVQFDPPQIDSSLMEFDVLAAARRMTVSRPILIVDEPMYITSGVNSDVRYNSMYPRWAFDEFRQQLGAFSTGHALEYVDLYNAMAPSQFTSTNFHLTPAGEREFAALLAPHVLKLVCRP